MDEHIEGSFKVSEAIGFSWNLLAAIEILADSDTDSEADLALVADSALVAGLLSVQVLHLAQS